MSQRTARVFWSEAGRRFAGFAKAHCFDDFTRKPFILKILES